MMRVLLGTILLLVQAVLSIRQDILCCRNKYTSVFKQCRNACSRFVAETDVTKRFHKLQELPKDCPGHLTELWRCLNTTNPASYTINRYMPSKMPYQAGLCCLLTKQPVCRKDCMAGKINSLNVSCAKPIDALHPSLISCVHRHAVTAQCCHGASRSCVRTCKLLFASERVPRPNMKRKFHNHCARYTKVLKCAEKNLGPVDARRTIDHQLHCCSKAKSDGCDKTCRKELLSSKSMNSVLAGIKAACKGPYELPENNDMWTCFLKTQPTPSQIPPNDSLKFLRPYKDTDGGKLQCCSKAVTPKCWTLCSQMYRSPLGVPNNYQEFDELCTYNPQEVALMNCLADVTKPCQLGCSGLNFCTNFNNRHTELFRSCDASSDTFAKSHMQQWHEGVIKVPGIPIVVQDIKKCLPETWKAIACLLQIKPCSLKSHRSTICQSDCIDILQKCGNSSKYTNKQSVEKVCNLLSPSEKNCISIKKYLTPSKYKDVTDEVTHPCNPNPCSKNKICNIERTCYAASLDVCEAHSCSLGCRLGEASSFLVRTREYAVMPEHKPSCFKLCYCKENGILDHCTRVNCVARESCFVKEQNITREHGEPFMLDCNYCVCFAGKSVCTRRTCLKPSNIPETELGRGKRNHTPMYTGLPCMCSSEYDPVCTSNGHTHHNPCIARCAGFSKKQMQKGNCESIDPCEKNPCKTGQRCLISRRTCLSLNKTCDQYVCRDKHCKNIHIVEPVCDTEGQQHPNQCSLQFKGKKHAYKGFCKAHCNQPTSSVCGINGETYSSECAAQSARVLVDYQGPCKAIGHGPGFGSEGRCENVKCPSMIPPNCIGIHPPGSCCPKCAAQVRILVSQTQLSTNSETLNSRLHRTPTLDDLLIALRRHVTTTECDLFGYQSIEGDVVILIKAITNKPTTLQIEACSLEAQRIEALINNASPSMTSHFILSTLKFADTQTPALSAQVQGSSRHLMSVEHLLMALSHTYIIIRWILRS